MSLDNIIFLSEAQVALLDKLRVYLLEAGIANVQDDCIQVLDKAFRHIPLVEGFSWDQLSECHRVLLGEDHPDYEMTRSLYFGAEGPMPQRQEGGQSAVAG